MKMLLGTYVIVFENDNTVIYPKQAAGTFNKYFLSVIERLNLTDVQADSVISILTSSCHSSFPIMAVVPVTDWTSRSNRFLKK